MKPLCILFEINILQSCEVVLCELVIITVSPSLHCSQSFSKFILLYSTTLHSTLLYSSLLYSTLLYSTLLYSTLLYSTPLSLSLSLSLPSPLLSLSLSLSFQLPCLGTVCLLKVSLSSQGLPSCPLFLPHLQTELGAICQFCGLVKKRVLYLWHQLFDSC